mgnify:CR=1 FL=1
MTVGDYNYRQGMTGTHGADNNEMSEAELEQLFDVAHELVAEREGLGDAPAPDHEDDGVLIGEDEVDLAAPAPTSDRPL